MGSFLQSISYRECPVGVRVQKLRWIVAPEQSF